MKQLLATCGSDHEWYFVVALNETAYVGSLDASNAQLVELVVPPASSSSSSSSDGTTSAPATGTAPKDEKSSNCSDSEQIQAVAGLVVPSDKHGQAEQLLPSTVYFAIARQSKQISMYCIPHDELRKALADGSNKDVSSLPSRTLHQAPKRVSRLLFVPTVRRGDKSALPVLLTADLAGDVFAYSVQHSSREVTAKEAPPEGTLRHRRLLLGHTASMLTALALTTSTGNPPPASSSSSAAAQPATTAPQYILTADRDEKIRVTHFPATFDIHGYLLGHSAFVSALAVVDGYCVSCGGDGTLRLWNLEGCHEMGCFNLQTDLTQFTAATGVPCALCVQKSAEKSTESAMGTHKNTLILSVAVIYDRSTLLHFLELTITISSSYADGSTLSTSATATAATTTRTTTNSVQFHEVKQVELAAQPLGLAAADKGQSPQCCLVLMQAPHYLQCYSWKGHALLEPAPAVQHCNQRAVQQAIPLPTAILERDQHDELKMSKNEEKRGPTMLMPWNDATRKEIHFHKRQRFRRRNRSKSREGVVVDGPDDGEDDDAGDHGPES